MAKKVLWSVAAAAAVALIALKVVGYPPSSRARRRRSARRSGIRSSRSPTADVKVDDQQFQAFLQSDLFRKLANDKAARKR